MSDTGCPHPEAELVLVEDEYTFLRWCPLCGSICNNNDVPGLTAGQWRAPAGLLLPGWTCTRVPRVLRGRKRATL